MAAISIKGVKKRYQKQFVVHGVDVEIEPGEFVVILGPAGRWSTSSSRASVAAPWCSRTMRSIRT